MKFKTLRTIVSKYLKYLEMSLMKDKQEPYTENNKTLLRCPNQDGSFGASVEIEDFYTTHQRYTNLPGFPLSE